MQKITFELSEVAEVSVLGPFSGRAQSEAKDLTASCMGCVVDDPRSKNLLNCI